MPRHADILIHFLHFIILWLRGLVAEDDAVHDKLPVVRRVSEVTPVGSVACAIFGVVPHALVDPVPDGTTHKVVGRLDGIPIVHEVAHGIAHRVGIFRDVEGVFDVHLSFHGVACPLNAWILVGAHIHDVVVTLILYGSGSIEALERVVGCHEVVTGSCRVA